MKKLKHLCAATVLTLTLTLSAFAGEMSSPGITSSSPQESSAAGDIGMPGATAAGEILTPGLSGLDPVTEAALGLLGSLLSLF
jgi:ABC-type amino acid transport system permease subunit